MTPVFSKTLNQSPISKADPTRTWGEAQFKASLHADPARALSRDGSKATAAATSVTADPAATDQALTQQAKNLVGQTFFATLLKQMHDSPFKSELFSGGKGGEAFNGLYDQTLAHHMAQKLGKRMTEPLVARYRKMAAAKAYAKQKSPNPSGTAATTTERNDVAGHR